MLPGVTAGSQVFVHTQIDAKELWLMISLLPFNERAFVRACVRVRVFMKVYSVRGNIA